MSFICNSWRSLFNLIFIIILCEHILLLSLVTRKERMIRVLDKVYVDISYV